MSNTKIWDDLKRVPPEHLKAFTRAGGFKGTAIKPMWTIHRMTEQFGPCGTGWGVNEPEFQVIPAGHEIMVFCNVSVWYEKPSQTLRGVGGDKVLVVQSNGPKADDEAFKKAFTDAVTNALKHLGAGADVHMGLWDGNKYADDADAKRAPDTQHLNGTPGASKAKSREPFDKLLKEMRQAQTTDGLKEWAKLRRKEIEALPDDWMIHFDEQYYLHKDSLNANGLTPLDAG